VRRLLRILSTALITAGVVVLADVGITLAWEEPVSSLYAKYHQGKANGQFEDLQDSFGRDVAALQDPSQNGGEASGDEARGARRLAGKLAKRIDEGEGIGRVLIPEVGVDAALLEGTDAGTLQKGPGRYRETGLPGQGGTVAIAGHRTTYQAPFRRLNDLAPGDGIEIELPYGTVTYAVEKTRIVDPSEVEILRNVARERLVLTACHPLYSAAQRIAVFARLDEIDLLA
jgi:sortase A